MLKELQKSLRRCRDTIIVWGQADWVCIPAASRRLLFVTILSIAACAWRLGAQEIVQSITPTLNSTATQSPLAALVAHSGIIFSGQVVSIERMSVQKWTTVRFNVETGVRGSVPGLFEANFIENFPDDFPLRPGERVVAFLHGRNAAGITSFVANRCGLFERTGGDRIDLGRLQFCPAQHVSTFVSLPEPVAFWPDPRSFLPEKSSAVTFSSFAVRTPPRTEPTSILQRAASSMSTGDFLRLISGMASNQQLRDGDYPSTRALSYPDLSGVH